MKIFLNILWHIPFLGFLIAIGIAITGALWCITIIGIPIGLGLFQFSLFLLWPHGYAMVSKKDLEIITNEKRNPIWKIFTTIVYILYLPIGLIYAIIMVLYAFAQFISIIGIPCGLVIMKSIGTYFNPVNKVRVPEIIAQEIERKKNEQTLKQYAVHQAPTALPQSQLPQQETIIVKVICPNCNERVDEAMSFCPYCGTSIRKKTTTLPPIEQTSNETTSVHEDNDNLRFAPPQYRKKS